MHDLNDLVYFAKVVEHGGFSEAGRQLGVPKSKLSRRISALESRLGIRLLQRSSRRITLTTAGQSYFDHCRALVDLAEAADESAMRGSTEPKGDVRISCSMTLAQVWLTPLIPGFMALHPKVRLQVIISNRRVDPVQERMDVVLRVRRPPLEDSDQIVRKLGESVDVLVASPAYLAEATRPREPEQIGAMATLALPGTGDRAIWQLSNGQRVVEVRHEPRLVTDDMFALKEAAASGLGLALLPHRICQDDLRAGRLELALDTWTSPVGHVQAAFTSRKGMMPAVRALLDYLDGHQDTDSRG